MTEHYALPSRITNPLVTPTQVTAHRRAQTEPRSTTDSIIFNVCLLTQTAGVLLHLPQEVIATSVVILQRYLVVSAINLSEDVKVHKPLQMSTSLLASQAATYIAAKQSFYPLSSQSILNVYALLCSYHKPQSQSQSRLNTLSLLHALSQHTSLSASPKPEKYHLSSSVLQTLRQAVFEAEFAILTALSFHTTLNSPYTLAMTYLSTLLPLSHLRYELVAAKVLAYLNSALLSPQLLFLTHQPNELAATAVYLAARTEGVELTDGDVEWWEVFDVQREELGFLVLALASLNRFVEEEIMSGGKASAET